MKFESYVTGTLSTLLLQEIGTNFLLRLLKEYTPCYTIAENGNSYFGLVMYLPRSAVVLHEAGEWEW